MKTGTLTITKDERLVLGLPRAYHYDAEEIVQMGLEIAKWYEAGGVLVLDFPVKIIDLREDKEQK